jgi:hypothetical protein
MEICTVLASQQERPRTECPLAMLLLGGIAVLASMLTLATGAQAAQPGPHVGRRLQHHQLLRRRTASDVGLQDLSALHYGSSGPVVLSARVDAYEAS